VSPDLQALRTEDDKRPVIHGRPFPNIRLPPGGGDKPCGETRDMPQLLQNGVHAGEGSLPLLGGCPADGLRGHRDAEVAARPEHAQGQLSILG